MSPVTQSKIAYTNTRATVQFTVQCAAISHQINFLIAHQTCNAATLTPEQVTFGLASIVSVTYYVSFSLYL